MTMTPLKRKITWLGHKLQCRECGTVYRQVTDHGCTMMEKTEVRCDKGSLLEWNALHADYLPHNH